MNAGYREARRTYYADGDPAVWFWIGIAWVGCVSGAIGALIVNAFL